MKHIFTLFTALMLIAAASQAQTGITKPIVSPNPAHDYIKVNWQMPVANNVTIAMYYATTGSMAKLLTSHSYGEGTYTEMFKLTLPRGSYFCKITIGTQIWTYKMLIQ